MTLIVNAIQINNHQYGSFDDIVDFKLNSELSAGPFGILEEGALVISIDIDDSIVHTVQDCENGKTHELSIYLLRPNMP